MFKGHHRSRFNRIDGGDRRNHVAEFPGHILARKCNGTGVFALVAQLVIAIPGLRTRAVRYRSREGDRSAQQVAFDDVINNAESSGLGRSDRVPFRAHFERLRDARQAREPLRAARARNNAELYFRLPHLRVRTRDAIMP